MDENMIKKLYNGEAISRQDVKDEITTLLKDNDLYNVATQLLTEQALVQADIIQMATNDIAINCGLTIEIEQANGTFKTQAHPSVAILDKATSQMTKIFKELHLFELEKGGDEFDF